jgi:hypothetical protein
MRLFRSTAKSASLSGSPSFVSTRRGIAGNSAPKALKSSVANGSAPVSPAVVKTSNPLAGLFAELQWIDRRTSTPRSFASRARSGSGTKRSIFRV